MCTFSPVNRSNFKITPFHTSIKDSVVVSSMFFALFFEKETIETFQLSKVHRFAGFSVPETFIGPCCTRPETKWAKDPLRDTSWFLPGSHTPHLG